MGVGDGSSADTALRVRDLRKHLRLLHAQQQQLVGQVSLQRTDTTNAAAREALLYAALQSARAAVHNTVLGVARVAESVDVLHALQQIIEACAEEDTLTLDNLTAALEALSKDAANAAVALRAQRAETLRVMKVLSRSWEAIEAEARRDRTELLRLHSERTELEGRTQLAALKHARELFGVPE